MSDEIFDVISKLSWPDLIEEDPTLIKIKCYTCKQEKPLDQFNLNNSVYAQKTRHGRHGRCKKCFAEHFQIPEVKKKMTASSIRSAKRLRAENPERYKQLDRENGLKRYGITQADYDRMLAAQGGHCAICPSTIPGGNGIYFSVDHCHITGKVRGLLCHFCNVGLGHFNHDISRMQRGIDYLVSHMPPLRPSLDDHRRALANRTAKLHRSFASLSKHSTN